MKRHGSMLIEIVISILVFLIGILALAGSLTLSLKMIVQSGEATKNEQQVVNNYCNYSIKRTVKHSGSPTDFGAVLESSKSIQFSGGQPINFYVYHFALKDKKGSDIYVVQGTN